VFVCVCVRVCMRVLVLCVCVCVCVWKVLVLSKFSNPNLEDLLFVRVCACVFCTDLFKGARIATRFP